VASLAFTAAAKEKAETAREAEEKAKYKAVEKNGRWCF
jgi:hypothetical protein